MAGLRLERSNRKGRGVIVLIEIEVQYTRRKIYFSQALEHKREPSKAKI